MEVILLLPSKETETLRKYLISWHKRKHMKNMEFQFVQEIFGQQTDQRTKHS